MERLFPREKKVCGRNMKGWVKTSQRVLNEMVNDRYISREAGMHWAIPKKILKYTSPLVLYHS